MITDGSVIGAGAVIERSILSPGVFVGPGAVVRESVVLNDAYIETGAVRSNAPWSTRSPSSARTPASAPGRIIGDLMITSIGKNARIPPGFSIGAGSVVGVGLRA